LLESLKKFVKIRRLWLPWDKVFSKSPMTVSNLFASLMRWYQPVRRSSNGVLILLSNPTLSKQKSWNALRFLNRPTLQHRQPEGISIQAKRQASRLMAILLVCWTTLITSTRWFMSQRCLKSSLFSV
jgi:hypothetical protein